MMSRMVPIDMAFSPQLGCETHVAEGICSDRTANDIVGVLDLRSAVQFE
jgi:hypothetical protein